MSRILPPCQNVYGENEAVSFEYLALGTSRAWLCDASMGTGKTLLPHRLLKVLRRYTLRVLLKDIARIVHQKEEYAQS